MNNETSKHPDGREPRPKWGWKIWILPVLALAGLAIGVWQPVGFDDLLSHGERIGSSPLFLGAAVAGMMVCFTFGLPGSLGLWLIAPFNPPLVATPLLLAGSVGGAAGAYFFAGRMGNTWRPSGPAVKIHDLLRRNGGFPIQTAMRMFPGFPHSVVNFAGGVLRLRLGTFLAAAAIGLAVKWGVYASAVHGVTDAVAAGDAVSAKTLWPLFALAGLLVAGAWAKTKFSAQ